MTPRRVATVVAGIALIVAGKFVGGFPGAGLAGLGIGLGVVGVGRREPHLYRRLRGEDPDAAPGEPGERPDTPRRWPEW